MPAQTPLITIITVVYNGGSSLTSTIESVMRQQARHPVAYIVIDGQSTDNTVAIIRQYAEHITYWTSQPDRGIYDAMNTGWEMADPDSYVLFLGAGDQIMSLPDVRTYSGRDIIYGTVMLGDTHRFHATADFRLRLGNTLHHQALLVPKRLHPAPPFDLRYPILADFDFNQRLLKAGHRFVFAPDFTAYALPGGISHVFNRRQSLAVVRKNFGWLHQVGAFAYYTLQRIRDKVMPPLRRFS